MAECVKKAGEREERKIRPQHQPHVKVMRRCPDYANLAINLVNKLDDLSA
jgi:hypothetical protein